MIASNYRTHAEALIRQMELDLSGSRDAATRSAWWAWLMEAGKPQPVQRPKAPAWWRALRAASTSLARSVKAAILQLFSTEL